MRKGLKNLTKRELINIIANLRQNNTKLWSKVTNMKAIIYITTNQLEKIIKHLK